jgi:hypothetical protein
MTEPTALSGPKILLQGDSGTGKTYSLGTIVDWAASQTPPRPVRALFTENGLETLLGYWRDPPVDSNGKPVRPARPVPANLAWHVAAPGALSLAALKDAANKVGLLTYESLTKSIDGDRGKNNPAFKILEALENFPDDRTGTKLGNIGTWGSDTIFLVDSLSELAEGYKRMVVGNKPVMAQNEYGVAQNNLMNILRYLTQGPDFTLVMTAHVQKQLNEVTGAMTLMTSAIGKAIGDDIPKLFSEVLFCYRDGLSWYWDTSASNVVTKTRYLPIKSKITPDLGVIMDKWLTRGAV